MILEEAPVLNSIQNLKVTSNAFENKGFIPEKYTTDGDNINPPLVIGDFPRQTKSLVLIVEDPDAPVRTWTHWLVWNINPTHIIKEASVPGKEGINDLWVKEYVGPCPPSGTHRYFFKVYALDKVLNMPMKIIGKTELEKAMAPYIIGYGELMGLYKRA